MAKDDVSKVVERYISSGRSEKDVERKEHYFKMALEIQPKNIRALNNMGLLLQQKCEFREAIRYYEIILNLGVVTKPSPIYYNIAVCLKRLGNLEGAKTYIDRALAKKPDEDIFMELKEEILDLLNGTPSAVLPHPTPKASDIGAPHGEWDPPAIATLASQLYYTGWNDYKYHRGLGETDLKEKIVRDKLANRIYCCQTCKFNSGGTCRKKGKVGKKVLLDSICKQFFPRKTD